MSELTDSERKTLRHMVGMDPHGHLITADKSMLRNWAAKERDDRHMCEMERKGLLRWRPCGGIMRTYGGLWSATDEALELLGLSLCDDGKWRKRSRHRRGNQSANQPLPFCGEVSSIQ